MALREILSLYDFQDSPETRGLIEGVLSVRSAADTARVQVGRHSAIARGVRVDVEFDEQRYSGSSVFLFATVLEATRASSPAVPILSPPPAVTLRLRVITQRSMTIGPAPKTPPPRPGFPSASFWSTRQSSRVKSSIA